MVPLVAFVLFGLYVRREAERLRAEDGLEVVRGRMKDVAGRPHVVVRLKLAGNGMATREELHLRQAIEDEIEQRRIGSIADASSGKGFANVYVVVADPGDATAQIREVLRERGVLDRAVIEESTAGQ